MIRNFLSDEQGATAVEYGIIVFLTGLGLFVLAFLALILIGMVQLILS